MKNKNKEKVELALSTINVTAITPKVIAPIIDDVARADVVVAQLFKPIRDLVNTSGRKLEIPIYKNYISISSDVAEGNTVPASSFSYDATTIQVAKFGIRVDFQKEAIESPQRDILKDAVYMTGKEFANELDLRAETILLDLKVGTISTFSGGTLGSTSLTPIIDVKTLSAGTISSVDYYDGKVLLASSIAACTVTFTYSNRCSTLGTSLLQDATGKQTLTVSDVFTLKNSMVDKTIAPDVMLLNSKDMKNLLADASFQNLFEYTDDKKYNGEIGKLLDLTLVSSKILPEGVAILVESDRLGYEVIKRDLTSYEEALYDYDNVAYHMWSEREYGVSDANAVGVVVNLKTGSYPAANL